MIKRPLLLALLAASSALHAQPAPDMIKRVDRIERELRAVQRKVFPDGTPLVPEIGAPAPSPAVPAAATAGNAGTLAGLAARLDALDAQVRTLTGQAEQAEFRLRQLEEQVRKLAETPAAPVPTTPRAGAAAAEPSPKPPASVAVERPSTGDAAEDGYIYGFRLWQAGQYGLAQAELKQVADAHPDHRRASFAQNLLGRAYLDAGNPAAAAIALYDGYKKWPNGERAAESLYWLGEALVRLKRPADACKVYAEFGDVYGASAAAALKAQVAAAAKKAKCAA